MYLAVKVKKIKDTPRLGAIKAVKGKPFVAAVAADPSASPPIVGNPGSPAIAPVVGKKEVAEVSHLEVQYARVEVSVESIAAQLGQDSKTRFYAIMFDDDGEPTLKRVKEKAGKRRKAPSRELFELADDDGNVMGEAVLP